MGSVSIVKLRFKGSTTKHFVWVVVKFCLDEILLSCSGKIPIWEGNQYFEIGNHTSTTNRERKTAKTEERDGKRKGRTWKKKPIDNTKLRKRKGHNKYCLKVVCGLLLQQCKFDYLKLNLVYFV